MTLTVGLQEPVSHVLQNVAATPQHRDKRAIASQWGSVPCRGPAPNRTVALEEAWSSSPASLPNRGEWHILGTTYQIMQGRKKRARRERVTFFTILPTHGVIAAATLSHKEQREVIHVPIDCIYIYIYIYIYVYTFILDTCFCFFSSYYINTCFSFFLFK